MSGLTAEGFEVKSFEEIVAGFEGQQRANVDPAINTTATSLVGNFNAIYGLALAELWELGQAIYDSRDPAAAEDISLDHIGAISGVGRDLKKKSTVTLTLTLDPGATVNAGAVVSVVGVSSVRFVTLADASNASLTEDDIDVAAEAEQFGPVIAGAGTLTTIESPQSGWTAVTNAEAAVPGRNDEVDEDYRPRRDEELAAVGGSILEAVEADVRKVDDVTSVKGFENTTDVTVDGMPPHTIEIVALGGDNTAVALAIWNSKAGGIGTHGNTSATITDSQGVDHAIKFTRPEEVEIGIRFGGVFDSTYDDTLLNPGVIQAIREVTSDPDEAAYFGVGRTVYLGRILAAGLTAQGVVNLTLNIAAGSPPGSSTPSAFDFSITIAPREIPVLGDFEVEG